MSAQLSSAAVFLWVDDAGATLFGLGTLAITTQPQCLLPFTVKIHAFLRFGHWLASTACRHFWTYLQQRFFLNKILQVIFEIICKRVLHFESYNFNVFNEIKPTSLPCCLAWSISMAWLIIVKTCNTARCVDWYSFTAAMWMWLSTLQATQMFLNKARFLSQNLRDRISSPWCCMNCVTGFLWPAQ